MYTIECPNCGAITKRTSLKNFSCNSCDNGNAMKNSLKELSNHELLKKLPSYYNFEKTINRGISVKIPIKQMLPPSSALIFAIMGFLFTPGGLPILTIAFFSLNALPADKAIFIIIFGIILGILFTLVGLGSIWGYLYVTRDTVEIKAERGQLSRTLTPIPVPSLKNIVVFSSNISQFYCKHFILYDECGPAHTTHRYKLYMKFTNSQNGKEREVSLISAVNPTPIWVMEILMERALE